MTPPGPLILPPQTPPNPHLTQPLQPNQTATTSGTDVCRLAIDDGSQDKPHLGAAAALVRLQSLPMVAPRGPEWQISCTCDTQSEGFNECGSENAMGSYGVDAGCGLGGWGYLLTCANPELWILVGLCAPDAARAAARMAIGWL